MRLTVPFHNKDLKRRTLESIIEQADLRQPLRIFPYVISGIATGRSGIL
jgi:hypothetical protein